MWTPFCIVVPDPDDSTHSDCAGEPVARPTHRRIIFLRFIPPPRKCETLVLSLLFQSSAVQEYHLSICTLLRMGNKSGLLKLGYQALVSRHPP